MEIQLRNISKAFNGNPVIQNTSMNMVDGGLTTLLGPSGCGKTTLLRMIAGLETPDTGEIYFDNRCVFSAAQGINLPPEKRGLGFVFQDFALWPHMSVFENVAFGLRAARRQENLAEKVKNALHAVRLDEFAQRYPHQLSGGQQQRVAFARAIVIEPQCILFDEPLSALDALLREEMRGEITELIGKLGISAVFVTHDQTEAMIMIVIIAVLAVGVLEQYDTPEEVYAHPRTEFAAKFIGSSNWIDGQRMFRPEKASLKEFSNALNFTAEVTSVQFLGNTYQVHLRYQKYNWLIYSPAKLLPGMKVTIYINADDIIQIRGKR